MPANKHNLDAGRVAMVRALAEQDDADANELEQRAAILRARARARRERWGIPSDNDLLTPSVTKVTDATDEPC